MLGPLEHAYTNAGAAGGSLSTEKAFLSKLAQKYPGKRAFITGAGGGLGLAFATELAKDGWNIAITDVNEQMLTSAAEALRTAGGKPTPYVFDVSDYNQFRDAVKDFEQKAGGIDIGINNAGIGCGGFLHESTIETFRKVIDINIMGVAHGCHLFVPIMKKQRSGHILNVASAAAFVAAPRMSAYNTSKAGVLALSETLRGELSGDGILVSVMMPTYVRTNIGVNALGPAEDNRLAQRLVEKSKLSAEEVTIETLQKMAAGEFYIILPANARFLWRFKRLMPDRFSRFIVDEMNRVFSRKRTTPSEKPSDAQT